VGWFGLFVERTAPIMVGFNSLRFFYSRSRPVNSEDSVETRLAQLCACPTNIQSARISDIQVQRIQTLLHLSDETAGRHDLRAWKWRPRIYAILRNIGGLKYMQGFIDSNLSDFYLPFTQQTLPQFVEGSESNNLRQAFLDIQCYYLSHIKEFETGEATHMCIGGTGDAILSPLRYLGRGGFG
jgi:hypothetical protein